MLFFHEQMQLVYSIERGAIPGIIIFQGFQQPDKGNTTFMFYLFTHGIRIGIYDLIKVLRRLVDLKETIPGKEIFFSGLRLI
jgi:hypothetical protein